MPARLKDIADALGIHTATVSRALNGSPLVSEDLRVRIGEAARSMNYRPNTAARSLRSNRSGYVSLLMHAVRIVEFHALLIEAVNRACHKFGYRLRIDHAGSEEQLLGTGAVDGIICTWDPSYLPEALLEAAERNEPPMVYTDCSPRATAACYTDNLSAGFEATRHLRGLGHERLAFFGAVPRDLDKNGVNSERVAGFVTGCRGVGEPAIITLPWWPEEVSHCLDGKAGLVEAVRSGVTGILACSGLAAVGAITHLEEEGFRVPADVSVIGFDDTLLTRAFRPRITVMRQAIGEIADNAVEMIHNAIGMDTMPESKCFKASLVQGGSTGLAPTANKSG